MLTCFSILQSMCVCGDHCGLTQVLVFKIRRHLKRFIHGRGNVVPQLLFNVDVSYTLQLVYHELAKQESKETMNFLNCSSWLAPQSNTIDIGEHTYVIGHCEVKLLASEQRTAACFSKLYKNGVVYHATSLYPNGNHEKRDSTVSAFLNGDNQQFGWIV